MYPARLARALRERGADAEGVDERGPLRGLADEELLVVAAREGRALVSENVADFMRLYGEWGAARPPARRDRDRALFALLAHPCGL